MAVLTKGTVLNVRVQENWVKIGALRSLREVKLDSEMVDVTTLDSPGGFRQYQKGWKSAADMQLEGLLDKTDAGQQKLKELYFSDDAAQFEMLFPDGETIGFSALVKSIQFDAGDLDGAVKFDCVLRVTGAPAVPGASVAHVG